MKKENIPMTYEMYDKHGSLPSTDYLMLCELIDNSCSSFLKRNNGVMGKIKDGFIDITIDESTKGNKKIIVIDNALGMNTEVLSNSMRQGNGLELKKDSALNEFGYGMKQAAFYLGRKMTVTSKQKNSIANTSFIDVQNNRPNWPIEYSVIEYQGDSSKIFHYDNKNYSSGSKIEIEYVRRGKLTPNSIEKHCELLGARYFKFLKNDLKIRFKYVHDSKKSNTYMVSAMTSEYENIRNFFSDNKLKCSYETLIKLITDQWSAAYKNNQINYGIYSDLMKKIKNEQDFMWTKKIEVKENLFVTVEIGWLKDYRFTKHSGYVNIYGFTVYQGGRALYSAPSSSSKETKEQHKGTYKNFSSLPDQLSGEGNHKRRWVGNFEIDDLHNYCKDDINQKVVTLDSNKSGFDWVDEAAKENFHSQVNKFMNELDEGLRIFHKQIINCSKIEDKKKSGPSNVEAGDIFNKQYFPLDDMEDGTYTFSLLNEERKSVFHITAKIDDFTEVLDNQFVDNIFTHKINKNKNEIVLKINSASKLWSPVIIDGNINETKERQLVIISLVFCLATLFVAKDKIECRLFNEINKRNKNDKFKNDPYIFLTIFSIITTLLLNDIELYMTEIRGEDGI